MYNVDHIYSDDYTWSATVPTIWRQVSYNLSVITACIPCMKPVIDAFSGDTFTVAIDAPYEMGTETGKGGSQLRSQAKSGARNSVLARSRQFNARPSDPSCETGRKRDGRQDGQSESVRGLREDFIVIREDVEVQFNVRGESLANGSHGIWDGDRGNSESYVETSGTKTEV